MEKKLGTLIIKIWKQKSSCKRNTLCIVCLRCIYFSGSRQWQQIHAVEVMKKTNKQKKQKQKKKNAFWQPFG